ncbi:hypothetical protein [Arenimonas caeni]|uniref:Terminase small subunit n=1 Tax=Arenimonas caeni TaxID=2058085 RepID=A0A2P6M9E9_9GAMM|nr:hypothetical protein [Arenimonas caeni]PRH82619.1 hypothetical protein C6N40_06500 [Arenimonas caeni]
MAGAEGGEVSRKAFARILGAAPSYITQLQEEGRLVLSADGKKVRVEESLALIRGTADPSKAGVAERHAAARGAPTGAAAADDQDGDDAMPSDPAQGGDARRRAKALADKAETDAKAAELDYRQRVGELLEAAEVEHLIKSAVTTFRGGLESLPDTLAPELSALSDEGRIRVVLGEAIEHRLEELSRAFGAIARREQA